MLKVGSIWCGWVQHVTSTGLVLLPHHVNIPKNKSETSTEPKLCRVDASKLLSHELKQLKVYNYY
jgi:hypothetical protein